MERIKIERKETKLIKEFLAEISNTFLRVYEQFSEKQLNEG